MVKPNDYLPLRETIMAVLIVLGAMAAAILLGGCAIFTSTSNNASEPIPWHKDALHTSPYLPLCCQCHEPEI